MELFLDEYPEWEIGGPCHPIILQSMFVHAAELGQREAERLICHSHQHGLPGLDLQVDVPAIWHVGYQTSQGEIRDLCHEVYMLRRLPSPLPFGPEQMEKATRDILSSLRDHLQERREITDWKKTYGEPPCPFHSPATRLNPTLEPEGGQPT